MPFAPALDCKSSYQILTTRFIKLLTSVANMGVPFDEVDSDGQLVETMNLR